MLIALVAVTQTVYGNFERHSKQSNWKIANKETKTSEGPEWSTILIKLRGRRSKLIKAKIQYYMFLFFCKVFTL